MSEYTLNKKVEGIFPLMPMQEGMIYHNLLNNEKREYFIQNIISVKMLLEHSVAKEVLRLIMLKYEALRTMFFYSKASKPRQIVLKEREIDLMSIDLRKISDYQFIDELNRIKSEDIMNGFNLEKDSLIRLTLLHKADHSTVMIWSAHHIIIDGWCLSLIFRDFFHYYKLLSSGINFDLVHEQMENEKKQITSYGEYVKWLSNRNTDKGLQYWKNLLNGYTEAAEILPIDRDICIEDQVKREKLAFEIEETLQIQQIAKKLQVTVSSFIEAAIGIMLQKYNRTTDVVFGKVVSGRNGIRKGLEETVGLFVNTIPSRVINQLDDTCKSVILSVHKQSIESMEFDNCALSDIQTNTSLGSSLFHIIYAFENYYVDQNVYGEINEIGIEFLEAREQTNYPISISAYLEQKLHLEIMFDPKEFSSTEVTRILNRLKKIVLQMALYPDLRINELELLDETERELVLQRFNKTQIEFNKEQTLIDLFEQVAKQFSNRTAIIYENNYISYQELNQRANQLANYLRKKGILPGDFIAIIANRGIEMFVALLGVMKSGAAYVPIDPDYPAERINYILSDCVPKLIITVNCDFQLNTEIEVFTFDLGSLKVISSANPVKVNNPDDILYVIYTSGTTGRPKGVLISHSGVINLHTFLTREYNLTANDIVLQFASYSFDAIVSEFSASLLNGAALCITPISVQKDTRLFEEYLLMNKVSFAILPPQYLSLVKLNGIRSVISAGSESNKQLVEMTREYTEYSNDYGPTEVTVCATHWKCMPTEKLRDRIPIGKPIDNKQIYILNNMELCGIGMPGEICIAGVGLALGYLNQPELTKEKFIPNPYGEGRIYRSGDLARWLEDGTIEYLGRIDEQVKIRGFRIELNEIENVIREIDEITETAVIARKDSYGDNYLIAYISADDEINSDSVIRHIQSKLPIYMVPTYIKQIDKIPVTQNGKLDKRALPVIDARFNNEYKAPTSRSEEILTSIYSEILNVSHVGVKDNFFSLGGHSLKATRLMNRIEAVTGIKIPLKEIFNNPTPEELAASMESLSVEECQPIPPVSEKLYYAITPAQKRLYIINDIEGEEIAYNLPSALITDKLLDYDRVKYAFSELTNQHDALRTSFHQFDEEPVQKIEKEITIDIDYEIVDELDPFTLKEKMKYFVSPFDLAKAPLIRIKLFQVNNQYSVLFFDMHHIISDGVSINLIVKEFSILYGGGSLIPMKIHNKDYSEWFANRDFTKQKEYWINQFEDDVPILDLPYDFGRPPFQSYKGSHVHGTITKEMSVEIQNLCRQYKTTEYMIYLSTFMILLSKISRQEDIVVGTPISGRIHQDTECMLSMFVNTLALKGQPSRFKKFNNFLNEIKNTCLNAYENQEYPFEKLIEAIKLKRDVSRNPIFDVMFVMQDNESINMEADGVHFKSIDIDNPVSKFDITFAMCKEKEGYVLDIEYCTDIFKEDSIERMAVWYQMILKSIIADPEMLLKDIDLLNDEEKILVLEKFNDTSIEIVKGRTVVELFEEQALKTPDQVAIIFRDQKLTYSELNERSNYLAEQLRCKGVGRDSLVAVITERSIEMIIGIYGIIKAGGAYVPIDPNYPEERIQYILEDSMPKALLLGDENYLNKVKVNLSNSQSELYCLVLSDNICKTKKSENPIRINQPGDLIYVIYTSGTTGRPKGVMNSQEGLINRILWMNGRYPIGQQDAILQKTTYTFDVSVWEIFWWSIVGAKVVMLEPGEEKEPDKICSAIAKERITVLHFVPSMLNTFLAYLSEGLNINTDLSSLHYVFSSGEALSPESLRNFNELIRNRSRETRLINVYGPTEASIDVTYFECGYDHEIIPIGKPISNIQIYILDDNNICGVGMPGELCIAGIGVARGYLNKPELTKEKFIDNPFGQGKMYRTGDLAKWLPDGNIQYLGRFDDQVKIRGFRIELGEIENALNKIPYISGAAVIAREDNNGEKNIYAYITSNLAVNIQEIRKEIGKTLADYMIPAYIMQINKIPVTHNGKLDKRALPKIEVKSGIEYSAPSTATEKFIVDLYEEILKINKVGIKDNFFDLGGHSLKATKLITSIESMTGIHIPLKIIFHYPTPEELAAYIKQLERSDYKQIPVVSTKDYYETSAAQKRIFILNELEGGITYNMPAGLIYDKSLDIKKADNAFLELIKRHDILRTSFLLMDGKIFQKVSNSIVANIEYEESEEMDTELIQNLIKKFITPFDLSAAPLMRMKIIQVKDQGSVILFDMHHIISDGISLEIFEREFSILYGEGDLPPLKLQYRDYSEWLFARDMSSQKKYWTDQFKDNIPVLNFPYDYSRPVVQSFKGNHIHKSLGENIREGVSVLSRQYGTTQFMIYLSSFMILLSKLCRQEDIIVGTPISGRTNKETESMLGMFVNTLALRGKPEGEKTYDIFLCEIKEMLLQAYENQEYPFEELVEAVEVRRDISRNPLFDVMFVMQNKSSYELTSYGNGFRSIEMEHTTSKFDFTFEISESEKGYELDVEYCTDILSKDSADRLAIRYEKVLQSIVENPKILLSDIDLLANTERTLVLEKFNNTTEDFVRRRTVMDLFEEQVKLTPDNIAVIYMEESVSYAELNERANYLAYKLRHEGIGRDDLVVIVADRSIEMIVGIYAIIKAGGAYVPIDPNYPTERIKYILEDCKPKVVLFGHTKYYAQFLQENNLVQDIKLQRYKSIDLTLDVYRTRVKDNPRRINQHTDLVYVIYTSGTSGRPKGVMNCHEGLINRILWMNDRYPLGEQDAILQKTTYTFDVSVWEIIWWSFVGAKVVMLEPGGEKEPESICRTIQKENVTIIHFVPSMLNVFLGYLSSEPDNLILIKSLKYVFSSGEALRPDSHRNFNKLIRRQNEKTRFINLYGPTEASIDVTFFDCEEEVAFIPIGKPIANTQIYILNNFTPCGIGMPGELCIAGTGVARGYLNRDDLTAEKFVKNPFGSGRLYRTGDLAKWLPDGNIQYLGRIDDQIKIRGFRIELGEIENLLNKIQYVTGAAVIAKEDCTGDKNIYAYITSEQTIDTLNIKKELSKMLPEYMLPSYIMQIDSIPITKNGKLDKHSLPEIEVKSDMKYIEPSSKTEEILVTIYQNILKVSQVGINDSFFDLGGHSLSANLVMSEILNKFGIKLRLGTIFSNPTVEKLAHIIDDQMTEKSFIAPSKIIHNSDAFDLDIFADNYNTETLIQELEEQIQNYYKTMLSSEINQRVPLSSIQEISAKMNILESCVEIRFHEKVDIKRLSDAWECMTKEQEMLHCAIYLSDETYYEVFDIKSIGEIPFVDISQLADKIQHDILQKINQLSRYSNINCYKKGLFSNCPILIKISDTEYKFILLCSHLAIDGFSKDLLIRKLYKYYQEGVAKVTTTEENNYFNYIAAMMRGPQKVNTEDIFVRYELEQVLYLAKLQKGQLLPSDYEYFLYNLNLQEAEVEYNKKILLVEALYKEYIKYTYQNTEIPVLVVTTGRGYKNNEFYDCIGECIDLMPVLFNINEDNMLKNISNGIDYAKTHNINFTNMISSNNNNINPKLSIIIKELYELSNMIPILNLLLFDDIDDELINQMFELQPNIHEEQSNQKVYHSVRISSSAISLFLPCSSLDKKDLCLHFNNIVERYKKM